MSMREPAPPPRPKKSWGQHFLIDPNIQRKILEAAEIQPGERVIEIGPGRGMLTKGLLEKGAEVTAVEIDPYLVQELREASHGWPGASHLDLVLGDALRYPYPNIPAPYKVVANLPYYLSTPLLFRFLEERRRLTRLVLMLQREVAERLASPPGSKRYGGLSVIFQMYMDIHLAFSVPRNCFRPRPQVDSSVLILAPREGPRFPIRDDAYFIRVVKGAFGHRRKQLINALVDSGFNRQAVERALSKTGIDANRRAENLQIEEFSRLANTLSHAASYPVDH